MKRVRLKLGRDESLRRRHPWVFSGAVQTAEGSPESGQTVQVVSADGQWLASGAYSPESQIRVRAWSFDPKEEISPSFLKNRLCKAISTRKGLPFLKDTMAYRLVNAESDGLPGMIIDRYGDFLVCQFLSTGAEYWRGDILRLIQELIPVTGIYERSEGSGRTKEGLPPRAGVLFGQPPPEVMDIQEGALRFLVDIQSGHKTGFYLDQRDNRALVAEFSESAEVLNCFAYTGGFGLWALKGGASQLTNVETSLPALKIAQQTLSLNGFNPNIVENLAADVFSVLRNFRDAGRQFDLIILDPPKFAASASQVKKAARGYKDINLLAIKLLRPGGILFTFSCSGHIERPLFQKIISDAALDAGRHTQILRALSQAADHPVSLNFPEGSYLKGLLCKVW